MDSICASGDSSPSILLPIEEFQVDRLSDDALIRVFWFLDEKSQSAACQVCRRWTPLVLRAAKDTRIALIDVYFKFLRGDSFGPQRVELLNLKGKSFKVVGLKAAVQKDVAKVFGSLEEGFFSVLDTQENCPQLVKRVLILAKLYKEIVAANQMPDVDVQRKSYALSEIVKKLTQVDIEWAIDVAEGIPDERFEKSFAFSKIAQKLVEMGQPGRALGMAKKIPNSGFYKTEALSKIALKLVEMEDINGARQAANAIHDVNEKSSVFCVIANKLEAMGDINQAIDVVNEIPDKSWKSNTFSELIGKLVQKGNVGGALKVVVQAIDAAKEISDEEYKSRVFCVIAELLTKMGSIGEALKVASLIPDESWRDIVFSRAALKLAEIRDTSQILQAANSINNKGYKVAVLFDVAQNLAKMGNKRRARQVASVIPSFFTRVEVFLRIAIS